MLFLYSLTSFQLPEITKPFQLSAMREIHLWKFETIEKVNEKKNSSYKLMQLFIYYISGLYFYFYIIVYFRNYKVSKQ